MLTRNEMSAPISNQRHNGSIIVLSLCIYYEGFELAGGWGV